MFTMVNVRSHFAEWLNEMLEERGWSQAELARRSGLSRSGISLLLSDDRRPTAETCNALAIALGLPAESVLMAADLLPENAVPDRDPSLQELMNVMKRMTEDERREILEYALWRFRRKK